MRHDRRALLATLGTALGTALGTVFGSGPGAMIADARASAASAASADPAVTAAPDAAVRFHAFAYRGSDAVFDALLPDGHFRNPVLAGFHPDPSLCRVGDDYYLVSSSFVCFPGLPVMHSRDLVNWQLIGHAIARAGQLPFAGLGVSRGLFAPALSHHQGRFYLCCTMVGGGGNFVITASDPAGPWSDPVWLAFDGIDPSIFFDDDDGSAWIVNNGPPAGAPRYDGHRAIWLQAFDVRTLASFGLRRVLVDGGAEPRSNPVWIEGPHLFRRDGWVYLCAAEGGTSVKHSQVIFRSRNVTGPFLPWAGNPILTQRGLDDQLAGAVSCCGHAQLVVGPDGHWWASFLGCRPGPDGDWLTGRETFVLPVHWRDDGWPQILPAGARVPALVPSPLGVSLRPPAQSTQTPPLTGNFSWAESFGEAPLAQGWLALRGPHQSFTQSTARGLQMQPRSESLSGRDRPALLARRVQHAAFDATVTLELPEAGGVRAGLALFQSETQHLFAAVQRQGTQARFVVEQCDRGHTAVIADMALARAAGEIRIRVHCDGRQIQLSCQDAAGRLTLAGRGVDARRLSVQSAGGGLHFTGLLVGLHARREMPHA